MSADKEGPVARYDFDRVVERRGTGSLKYDWGMQRVGRDDLLPLWVADMDFPLPDEILDDIKRRVDHGIFGYTEPADGYYDAMEAWFARHYGWRPEREWNTVTPGVVYALAVSVQAFTEPGDAVLVQEPVYYPFRETIELNGRRCVSSDLVERDGRYEVDFDDFERMVAESGARLFLLCSPHNPVGRVWTRDELERMARICERHGVQVVADEIHCDFIRPGVTFTPYALLSPELASRAVYCTSASKTFNTAALQTANIIIPDPGVRAAFRRQNAADGYSQANALGLAATEACWRRGEEWHEQLLAYLWGNLDCLRRFLREQLPQVRLVEPEGTYLMWMDFSRAARDYDDLHRLVQDEARLWLDEGVIFGKKNEMFERINIACPRSTLERALRQLKDALDRRAGLPALD